MLCPKHSGRATNIVKLKNPPFICRISISNGEESPEKINTSTKRKMKYLFHMKITYVTNTFAGLFAGV